MNVCTSLAIIVGSSVSVNLPYRQTYGIIISETLSTEDYYCLVSRRSESLFSARKPIILTGFSWVFSVLRHHHKKRPFSKCVVWNHH
jgi:hypothetical protein